MTRKHIIMAVAAMCMIGFLSANSLGAGTTPTIEKVLVSPASCNVLSGSEVRVIIKAKAAHPDDVLAYKLWTRNGTFTEWFPLSSASQVEYFPPSGLKGPGTVLVSGSTYEEWCDADGVMTFTADADSGEYEIGCGVTVVQGPNKGGHSRVGFSLRVTRPAKKAPAVTLTIIQKKLANVFVEGEPVFFGVESTGGKRLVWNVRDFWGQLVLKGAMDISGSTDLTIPMRKKGYFLLELEARKSSGETAIKQTPFAVLEPFDLKTVMDSPFGIQTHYGHGEPKETMPLVALAGIKNLRDNPNWHTIEREKGKYTFSDYDKIMKGLKDLGIEPSLPLIGSVKFYDNNFTPYTTEGLAAFARYCQALVKNYAGFLKSVEVWNEYDSDFCKGPAASKPENYVKMLKAVYPAVKAASPKIKVIGCVATPGAWAWMEKVFQLGGLNYMDAVSMHPYRWQQWHKPPWTLDADMARLTKLIAKYNPDNLPRPIWATELSWPTRKGGVSLETQADYIVRTYIVLIANGVEKIFWFRMPEGAGYGVIWGGFNLRLKAEMTPKPSYVSTAVVTRQLSGAKFVRREKTQGWIRSYLFRKGEEDIRVLWGTRPGTVTIKANSPLTLTDMMGERELLYPKDGEAYLTLSGSPLYVQGRIDEIIAGGKISVTGETEVATGDEIPVKFLFDNSLSAKSFSGELEVEGKQLLFGAKGGGKSAETVSVPAERAGERNIIYRVKVDNRLIGKGVLTTRIRDPLAVTAVLTAKGGLGIKVINDSKTTEYVISSVNWRVYRRMGTSDRNVLLLPGKKETIRIPTPWVQTSQVYPVSVNVTFKTGAPLVFSGELKASP